MLHGYQVTRLRALQRIDLAPGLLGLIPDQSADTGFCLCYFSSHFWSLQAALHHSGRLQAVVLCERCLHVQNPAPTVLQQA